MAPGRGGGHQPGGGGEGWGGGLQGVGRAVQVVVGTWRWGTDTEEDAILGGGRDIKRLCNLVRFKGSPNLCSN